jgi:hypothetical protein
MNEALLVLIGISSGVTTVLFGFGGGFITVPVMVWVSSSLGNDAPTVAVGTSSAVMVINAAVATASTRRAILVRLRRTTVLLLFLAVGGGIGALLARAVPGPVISWSFIAYLLITILHVLLLKGFIQPRQPLPAPDARFAIPNTLGMPIGALSSFLGVGGSMMTVPLLRRSGLEMHVVTALANPLTLAISVPACLIFLMGNPVGPQSTTLLLGAVDLRAAGLLLLGGIPTVVLLRRRRPQIPDRAHAWGYVVLLAVVLATMLGSVLG